MRRYVMAWSMAVLGLALAVPSAMAELKAGAKAPDFTVKDLQGKPVKFSQLRGNRPILVNFFATW